MGAGFRLLCLTCQDGHFSSLYWGMREGPPFFGGSSWWLQFTRSSTAPSESLGYGPSVSRPATTQVQHICVFFWEPGIRHFSATVMVNP